MSENNDRPPPKRVRLTGLQEAQLGELLQVEAKCAAMYHAKGFDAAEVPVRTARELADLVRHHSVHVAEADHVPVALMAWRDESPGVAYLADLQVHPVDSYHPVIGLPQTLYSDDCLADGMPVFAYLGQTGHIDPPSLAEPRTDVPPSPCSKRSTAAVGGGVRKVMGRLGLSSSVVDNPSGRCRV